MWTILLQVFLISYAICERDAKPELLKSKTYYTSKVGQTVRLKCMLANSTRATVKWRKDGVAIGELDAVKGHYHVINRKLSGLLRIKNTVKKDAGEYVCEAVNKHGSASRKLNLTIKGEDKNPGVAGKGKPWFIKQPVTPIQYVAWPASADIKFKCDADGEQPISYKWLKNGNSVFYRRLDPKMNTTRWYLRIRTAVPSDDGLYTCIVSNRLGNISKSIKFTVLEKGRTRPILSIGYPQNKTVKSGSNVTFECRELVSTTLTDYRWLKWNKLPKNYRRIQLNDSIYDSNSSDYRLINAKQYKAFKVRDINDQDLYGGRVILQNVSKEDAGLYTCLVSNHIGSVWKSAFLIIDDKEKGRTRPILSIGYPQNKTVKSGSNVTFECRELVSTVLTDYRWLKWNKLPKNYRRIQLNDSIYDSNSSDYRLINAKQYKAFKVRDIYGGRVILQNVSKEDAGLYTCLVSNHIGSVWKSAFLIIDDKESTVDTHEATDIPTKIEERVEINQSSQKFIIILIVLCIVAVLIFASVGASLVYYRMKTNKRKERNERIPVYNYQNVAQNPTRSQNEYVDLNNYKTY